ncbi:MFS transporter [Paenibacillus sanfengchensis]|uniref:MFS transporter n=1 Tax=Paenibacillus TaxID=44249 RepID=UPI003A5C751C
MHLSRAAAVLYAFLCGTAVAAVYFSQPLLDVIAIEFDISKAVIGTVITATQLCYALGLFLLVPLGDRLEPRRLVTWMLLLSSVALSLVAFAPSAVVLFLGMGMVGFLAVVAQVLVALAAARSLPADRGKAIGLVTSGIVIGILLARTFSGTLADLSGWRMVYIVSAAISVILACFFVIVTPAATRRPAPISYLKLLGSMKDLFRIPLLRVRAMLAFFIFAAFGTLWSSMVLPLSSPPFSLSHTAIGLFGLAGAAGALAARSAGRLADKGLGQRTTGWALLLLALSWVPIGLMQKSLWIFVLGVIMLDYAVQAVHVTNQTMILSVLPEARSRLTAGYMIFYSLGSAAGAVASTLVYSRAGWLGVCILGGGISTAAILFWAGTRKTS